MKKIVLLAIIIGFIFAKDDKYLIFVNKLVNYNFELEKLKKIKAPFEVKVSIKEKQNTQKVLVKKIKIDLIAIFNNKAYIKLSEFLGDQLIKTKKEWVKIGDKIYKCKVTKIMEDKVIFNCKDKKLVKSLNKKIPGLKELK
jgi:hypothetical protein